MVLERFEFCFLYRLTDVLLDSTKIATVAHSNRKTRTTQADISVKKSENYYLKAKTLNGNIFSELSLLDLDGKMTSAG